MTYHGGQDREEEGGRGHVAGALCEGGGEEAQDHGDGPRRDGVKRRHLGAQPARQARLLGKKKRSRIQNPERDSTNRNLPVFLGFFFSARSHFPLTSLPLASAKPPPSSSTMFQGILACATFQVKSGGAGPRHTCASDWTQQSQKNLSRQGVKEIVSL